MDTVPVAGAKGIAIMCVSCGCGEPNERHGDDRHITQDDLNKAAEAAEISPEQVALNIGKSGQQASNGD